jgi:hypothetical protein
VLAYVLGLLESSVMSLTTRAQNITYTATNEGVSEGSYLARGGGDARARARADRICYLPLRSDGSIARVRLAFQPDLQRSLHVLTRARCSTANLSHVTDALGLLEELCNI